PELDGDDAVLDHVQASSGLAALDDHPAGRKRHRRADRRDPLERLRVETGKQRYLGELGGRARRGHEQTHITSGPHRARHGRYSMTPFETRTSTTMPSATR